MRQWDWPAISGAIIGAAIGFFVLVYLPMKSNYDECGTVTLCPPNPSARHN